MDEQRPAPEEILKRIKAEEIKSKNADRGRLKIFLGYCAGVGKTFAMLDAARDLKKNGIDVVAGYIEPHARPETMAMEDGIEAIAPRLVAYKGVKLRELDLDAALKRKPKILLVDELAHTNAPGLRHQKRYQDIDELLDAGINVYTTVNIQHFESLNDLVGNISGIRVKETVPDRVFDEADQVEVVDIEPDDLIDRLKEGKIYKKGQAERALENFFTREKLIALREITLRRTADRVNRLAEEERENSGKTDYYTGEHVLTCISPSPTCAKVIRTAARLSYAFRAKFTALCVETPDIQNSDEKAKKMLESNIRLAKALGAEIITVFGEDVAYQIAEYAKVGNVSKIVMGRTTHRNFFGASKMTLSEQIINCAPNLDIYIIPDTSSFPYNRSRGGGQKKREKRANTEEHASVFVNLLKIIGILFLTTCMAFIFREWRFSEANITMLYILGCVMTALYTDRRIYSLVSAAFGVLTYSFFFTVPKYSFNAYDKSHFITFGTMFIVAFITSSLLLKMRSNVSQSARVAYRTSILLENSRKLRRIKTLDELLKEICGQVVKLLNRSVLIYWEDDGHLVGPRKFQAEDTLPEAMQSLDTAQERAVAQWVYLNGHRAGATTHTLPMAQAIYLPIAAGDKTFAVIGIELPNGETIPNFEYSLLIAMLNEAALTFEKEATEQEKKAALLKMQQEQLRANLLRSISHDLRTPLTAISGNAGMLLDSAYALSEDKKKQLYGDIYDDSVWLYQLVENLLSITKIENGSVKMNMTPEIVSDVLCEAISHVHRRKDGHEIILNMDDELFMAWMDARLIMQLIVNLVDNAIKYTPSGCHVEISAHRNQKAGRIVIEVSDDGEGIEEKDKSSIFDMFYSGAKTLADSTRSMGIGLYLCKCIAAAHGGELKVRENHPHGTIFYFDLKEERIEA